MEFIKQHILLTAILVVAIIGVAWYEFTSNSGPAPVLTSAGTTASTTQDAQLISTLLQLQSVTLNGVILSDPGFLSLQDFTSQVTSEPVGRPNPFAPTSVAPTTTPTTKLSPNLFAPKASAQ